MMIASEVRKAEWDLRCRSQVFSKYGPEASRAYELISDVRWHYKEDFDALNAGGQIRTINQDN